MEGAVQPEASLRPVSGDAPESSWGFQPPAVTEALQAPGQALRAAGSEEARTASPVPLFHTTAPTKSGGGSDLFSALLVAATGGLPDLLASASLH